MENNKELAIQPIEIKDDSKVIVQSSQLVEQANALEIKNDLSCQQAKQIADTLKAFIDGPGKYHDDDIELANALHKKLCQKRNAIVDGPKMAYKAIKDKIAGYIAEQQRKREEAQRRAEEAARKAEAEKQAKIQAKIDEENAKLAEIEDQEARAKAEAKISSLEEKKEAVYVPTKIVAPVTSPKGASVTFVWDAKVTDKKKVPETYKVVDIAMVEKMQKAAKGVLNIPGIEFTKRAVGSLRR